MGSDTSYQRNQMTLVLVVSVWLSVDWQIVLEIDLDKVPLKYQRQNGTEIAISESQGTY